MTRAQRRAAQERLQKQAQDAQTAGTRPTWFHTATSTSWQIQGIDPTWQPHGGSANTPWGHEPSAAFSRQQGGGTYFGYGSATYEAGPSASARFAGDPLSAIFWSLTIQDQRTAGMAQQLNQVDERTQVIQQTQDEQYNRLLKIEATVQRTFDESQSADLGLGPPNPLTGSADPSSGRPATQVSQMPPHRSTSQRNTSAHKSNRKNKHPMYPKAENASSHGSTTSTIRGKSNVANARLTRGRPTSLSTSYKVGRPLTS
ncbi:hypothetical protein U9M48_024882, partial [Paspalum notatum var. saurae]